MKGTRQARDRDAQGVLVEAQNAHWLLRVDSFKFVISAAHGLVKKMTELSEKTLNAQMSPHTMACAITVVSFGLTFRVNELLG